MNMTSSSRMADRSLYSHIALLRHTAIVLTKRQVSSANLPFITSRLEIIRRLCHHIGSEAEPLRWLAPVAGYLNLNNYKEISAHIQDNLPRILEPSGGFVRMSIPKRLPLAEYDRICVMFSPEIGIGDEVTFFQLLRNFPQDKTEIWSTIPELWHRLGFPRTKNYCSDPDAPFRSFRYGSKKPRNLLIYISFLDGAFVRSAYHSFNDHELLQITLGDYQVQHWALGKTVQTYRPQVDKLNNYQLMVDLQRYVFECPGKLEHIFATYQDINPTTPRSSLKVLVNPLTSKKMIISPDEWATLVSNIVSDKAGTNPC